MIKTQIVHDLSPKKEREVKKSFSLKKTMIKFPFGLETSLEPKLKTETKLKVSSLCIKSLQIMKKKVERQRYVKNFDELTSNPQRFSSQRFCRSPENSIKRSNSIKVSSSKMLNTHLNFPSQRLHKRSISSAFKIQEAKNIFEDFSQMKVQQRNLISPNRLIQKFQTQKKEKYNLEQYFQSKNDQGVFTCQSLQKSQHIQFCNEHIAAIINKKRPCHQLNEEGFSDETSFKAILQKIKSKDFGTPKNIVKQKKFKFIEKNYASPKLVNYNFLIQSPQSQKSKLTFERKYYETQGWGK